MNDHLHIAELHGIKMTLSKETSGELPRIRFACNCGKRLAALPENAGQRVLCPACGNTLVIPGAPTHMTSLTVDETTTGLSRTLLLILWSAIAGCTVCALIFVVWFSTHQARKAKVNSRISQALSASAEWVDGGKPEDGERIETELAEVLNNPYTTDKRNVEKALKEVQERRVQIRLRKEELERSIALDNERFLNAMSASNDWLKHGTSEKGEGIERTLANALKSPHINVKRDGEIVLTHVRQRRAKLAEEHLAALEQQRKQAEHRKNLLDPVYIEKMEYPSFKTAKAGESVHWRGRVLKVQPLTVHIATKFPASEWSGCEVVLQLKESVPMDLTAGKQIDFQGIVARSTVEKRIIPMTDEDIKNAWERAKKRARENGSGVISSSVSDKIKEFTIIVIEDGELTDR